MDQQETGEIKKKRGRPKQGIVPERLVHGVAYELYVSLLDPRTHYLSYRREGYTELSPLAQIRSRFPTDKKRRESKFVHLGRDLKFTRNLMLKFKRIGHRVYEIQRDFYDKGDFVIETRKEAARALQCHYLETCFCHKATLDCKTYWITGGGKTRRGKEIPTLGVHYVKGTVRLPRFETIGLEPIPEQTVEVDYTLAGEYCEEGLDWVAIPIVTRSAAKEPITIYFIAEYYYKFDYHEPTF